MGEREGKKGGRVVRWQGGRGGRRVRWQDGKGGRVVWLEGGGFLVLCKGGDCRGTPRFYLLVSDVNEGKEKASWIQDFLMSLQEWKDSSLIFCEM